MEQSVLLLPATSRSFLVADFFGCCSRAWRCSWRSSCRKVGTGSTDCSLADFSITKVRLIAKVRKGTIRLKVVVWSPLSLHFASCCAMLKLLLVLGCCQLLPAGVRPYGSA